MDYRRLFMGASSGGYSPASEGDARLWIDVSETSTLAISGTKLLSWGSRVGGVSMSAAPTGGPTYGANAWDGIRPCITFNNSGYSDVRANGITGLTDFFGSNGAAGTLIFRAISPIGTNGFLYQSYSSGGGYAAMEGRTLFPQINAFWSSGGAHASGVASYATNVSFTYSVVLSGNTVATFKNGSGADIPATAFTPAAVSDFSIGGGALLGNNGLLIKIPEVLLYQSALSTAALDRVHSYLAAKWP